MDQYPYMVIIPLIHITPMWTSIITLFIIINLSTKSIFLSKHEVLAMKFSQEQNKLWLGD